MNSGGKWCPQFEGIVEVGSQWMGGCDHRREEEELAHAGVLLPTACLHYKVKGKKGPGRHSCASFNPAKLGSNRREDIGYCRHREQHRSPQAAESILPV